MKNIRRSYCGLCHPRCGALLHIEDGKVVKVTGDPDHPITRGSMCERGRLMPDHLYHPQRLNYPLTHYFVSSEKVIVDVAEQAKRVRSNSWEHQNRRLNR